MNRQAGVVFDVVALNLIQEAWMKLQSDDPEPTKRKVLADVATMPRSYLSVNQEGTKANVVHHEMPFFSEAQPMAVASEWAKQNGIQTLVAWQCDHWIGGAR